MAAAHSPPQSFPLARLVRLGLFLLSAATLTFEINLTRLFSVGQFYHFAFMIVSMALLGFGASGTFLSIFPRFGRKKPGQSLAFLSLACGISMLGAYLLTNWLPFDSFSIAWDRRQVGVLVLHYLALSLPFFFSGMVVGVLLADYPRFAGQTYAVNLLGSALGCILALAAPPLIGGEGTVAISSSLAAFAALIYLVGEYYLVPKIDLNRSITILLSLFLLTIAAIEVGLGWRRLPSPSWLELRLSPYKSLSYAMQYPGAQIVFQRWNSFSRVDLVRSQGIRSLPGLSYRFLQLPPAEDGLLVDGDELSPVVLADINDLRIPNTDVFRYLPAAIAFQLRRSANVLILEPRGGLDVITALDLGADRIIAVESNPLIVQAAAHVYDDPRVKVILETARSYTRRSHEKFDLVLLSLVSSYHPVHSGAYSLAEDYRYTVESFQDALARLDPNGLLVVTRWLQSPPSEELRAFALAVTAIENLGGDPHAQIVAYRGYNTATMLVKNGSFTAVELDLIRHLTAELAFDLNYAPDIRLEETNRYNVLPESIYYQSFVELLEISSRQAFYLAYPYEVTPPTDDRPFFGHFFKWSQTEQVLAELGKTWQPFGGAGYFVVLALLLITTIMAVVLILSPVVIARWRSRREESDSPLKHPLRKAVAYLMYFGLIGLAYLLVEIPLIQGFILFLGHPAYALSAILFTLLLFSGVGSRLSDRIPLQISLIILALILLVSPFLLPALFDLTLGLALPLRLTLTIVVLAPLGFLMGIPFPRGIGWLLGGQESAESILIPWIWAVNGAASVVASVLAALLALTLGFSWVLRLGALCYATAWLVFKVSGCWRPFPRPLR
jgi:hypothetical protein